MGLKWGSSDFPCTSWFIFHYPNVCYSIHYMCVFCFETRFHVAQAGLEYSLWPNMTFWSSLSPLSQCWAYMHVTSCPFDVVMRITHRPALNHLSYITSPPPWFLIQCCRSIHSCSVLALLIAWPLCPFCINYSCLRDEILANLFYSAH